MSEQQPPHAAASAATAPAASFPPPLNSQARQDELNEYLSPTTKRKRLEQPGGEEENAATGGSGGDDEPLRTEPPHAAGGGSGERGRGNSSKRGRGGGGRSGGSGRGSRGGGSSEGAGGALPAPDASGTPSGSAGPSVAPVPASLTPLQHQFTLFARVLDARNDRREQIFHASRELTRASKKLITQLQRCTVASEAERHKLLSSARSRELAELHRLLHACVSSFSCPSDYYRFSSAFSPGVQEFVEAASFLHYLEHPGEMITQQTIEDDINRTLEADKEKHAATTAVEQQNQQPQQQQEPAGSALSLPKPPPPPPTRITLPLSDYILGVTDLGGELMRYATNSVTLGAAGRVVVEQVGSFLRQGHAAFQLLVATLPPGGGAQFRDLGKKLEVWLQSVQKLELLAYRLHIRAAEFPEGEVGARMLAQALLIQDGGGGAGRGGGDDEREAGGAADD